MVERREESKTRQRTQGKSASVYEQEPRDRRYEDRMDKALREQAVRIKHKAHLIDYRITSAESMTSGRVFSTLTSVPGGRNSTETGAIIAYSDDAKAEMLDVPQSILKDPRYGAVSGPSAKYMALHALENTDADIAVAVTGFAGQSLGGYKFPKPAGTVFIAVAFFNKTQEQNAADHMPVVIAREFHLDGKNREKDILDAKQLALDALEETLDREINSRNITVGREFRRKARARFYANSAISMTP